MARENETKNKIFYFHFHFFVVASKELKVKVKNILLNVLKSPNRAEVQITQNCYHIECSNEEE